MTDVQLYLAIGVPMLFNALLFTLFTTGISKRMDDKFAALDKRFEDMRDLWRAELHSAVTAIRALIEKNHSETLARFGDVDAGLTRLENERRFCGKNWPRKDPIRLKLLALKRKTEAVTS